MLQKSYILNPELQPHLKQMTGQKYSLSQKVRLLSRNKLRELHNNAFYFLWKKRVI